MVHSPVCVPVVAFGLDSSQAASNSHDVNAVIVNTTIKRDLLKFYKVYGSKIFTKNIIFRKLPQRGVQSVKLSTLTRL